MRAMVLEGPDQALSLRNLPEPAIEQGQVLIRVQACAVCRTDLHLLDGELADIPYPVIPGHQVVGTVVRSLADTLPPGRRVGVPWLGYTCGRCRYCSDGLENLCDRAGFTGYTRPGGYAEYLGADARYCFPVDEAASATDMAPLLCGGLIGFRALGMCAGAEHIGLYGFGSAAHILAHIIRYQGRSFYAFTRPDDRDAIASARALGAAWAGSSERMPPRKLDAAIVFAPVGALVPAALRAVRKGGIVVCGGIHMSPIPEFPYELLWGERQLRSVANLTREDGRAFLKLAARVPVAARTEVFPLTAANEALDRLRSGRITGSAVLSVAS
ncbi:MAG: zinc-dependent alcohol dehydrogenase family protein [Rhodospirillaceae bacterium]|nr:zinc-dependent alcohol dehydrogenase family protein [Rhodospirillaceae bacterium]